MRHNPDGAINALTKVTTRENGSSCRTALQLAKGKVNSVDVLFPNGELLCRLNITSNEDNNWGNVDVIAFSEDTPKEKRKEVTAKAWSEGTQVLNKRIPHCTLIAVGMKGPDIKVDGG